MDAHRDEPATKKDLDQVKQELTQVKQDLTTRIDQVEERLTAKIDANSVKIDRIALQVIENREQMATKDEVNERFDELLRGQDEMIGIFTRLDEERVATTAWIRRVEGDLSASEGQAGVETNKSEIKKIKTAKELRDRKIE